MAISLLVRQVGRAMRWMGWHRARLRGNRRLTSARTKLVFVGRGEVYFCWIKGGLHEAILSSTAMVGKRFTCILCLYDGDLSAFRSFLQTGF